MHALAISCALLAVTSTVRDGTVIVLENSNAVVETYTGSEVTHVGLIVNEGGTAWVYEAAPAAVRKVTLERYYGELSEFNRGRREKHQLRVRLYQPRVVYTDEQTARLKSFLNAQLGRRYSVKGYVRKKPGDGVHCAEFVSMALARTGLYSWDETFAIAPSMLVTRIRPLHADPMEVALPIHEPHGDWCERSWQWWAGFFAWCGWASWEAFTFCR